MRKLFSLLSVSALGFCFFSATFTNSWMRWSSLPAETLRRLRTTLFTACCGLSSEELTLSACSGCCGCTNWVACCVGCCWVRRRQSENTVASTMASIRIRQTWLSKTCLLSV
uniref:Putative secreted protein n=1 Tax=Ixodes ricinus TaxID=34613 RepID=A0A6B0UJV1_IXORI